MLSVVAGVIESGGKILVCQRRRGDIFELMWEFPGGKVKPGETWPQALRRELLEELGASAEIGAELFHTQHRYAEMSEPIDLTFFAASMNPDQMRNLAFEKMEWRAPERLHELNFLPADREFIAKLAGKKAAG
jgi:8-oxo-dGTP diphosphatase